MLRRPFRGILYQEDLFKVFYSEKSFPLSSIQRGGERETEDPFKFFYTEKTIFRSEDVFKVFYTDKTFSTSPIPIRPFLFKVFYTDWSSIPRRTF